MRASCCRSLKLLWQMQMIPKAQSDGGVYLVSANDGNVAASCHHALQ
jgi:hypothetical protein